MGRGSVVRLVVVLALVAGPTLTPEAASASNEHVHIEGFVYIPSPLSISPGTSVEWDNHDLAQHTVTSNDGVFNSPLLNQGGTFSFTFTTPGSFPYFCQVHGQGMSGTVNVVDPNAPDLVVESLTVNDTDTFTKQVTAVVRNIGSGTAGSSHTRVGYQSRGRFRLLENLETPALGVGQSATVSTTWDVGFKVGDFTVEARADFFGAVEENKSNNTRTTTASVHVSGVPGVDPLDP